MTEYISKKDAASRMSDLLMLELKGERLPTWNDIYNAMQDIPPAYVVPFCWIPCSERLPKKDGEYIATFGAETGWFVDICDYDATMGWGFFPDDGGEFLEVSNVLAWMPLPEPWKG